MGTIADWTLSESDRTQPAGRVLALLLEGFLADFRRHEAGVLDDADPEALHQYRVSLRRTRSLLAAGRSVYPAEELALLRALTASWGALTTPIRDLDVLLAHFDEISAPISDELDDGLVSLRAELERQRHDAHGELVAAIAGDRHHALLRRWTAMASVYRVGGGEPGPHAHRPTEQVAQQLIRHARRVAHKRGRVAARRGSFDDWHEVRKKLKRLRYLLMAFEAMYEPGSLDKVLRRLARMQDRLGELQDLRVQARLVEGAGLRVGGVGALAAGAVADRLHQRSQAVLAECRSTWEDFDRPKTKQQIKRAIRPQR